ncbi:RES domain-containing protein [Acinetobacter pittii]|uniref:RES domain-containing protein n=1 Tax=Acinetobacter pittii TaxID=48296 RepID=UPI0021BF6DFE|nr:RES domain-containing protein [Acinetobacter pittii]MCT9370223.1 RES domain-containing protein [Acinetobacter baumannii]MDV7623515.1 RES domain-containing protein [Acinetobacter baumannii]WVH55313.1 RES domain-containing protein [Acinetobacter pittii]
MTYCCSNCFNDSQIKKYISNKCHDEEVSRCSFCSSNGVQLIEASLLFEYFEVLVKALDQSDDGRELKDSLQHYFSVFNNQIYDKETLVKSIFKNNLEYLNYKYIFSYSQLYDQDWESFKEEVVKKNRFFPQTPIYKDIFSKGDGSKVFFELTETLLATYGNGDILYRARISEKLLQQDDMGKPPYEIASIGRANPIGITYLYLANNQETCIAEVRPSKGEKVCIGSFKPVKQIKFLDLTQPREKATFLLFNGEDLINSLNYIALLEKFANELSLPVIPSRSHLDYIPTQFICEFFKVICGYAGVIFNSSFGMGVNIVLFNDEDVICEDVKHYQVAKITHEKKLL